MKKTLSLAATIWLAASLALAADRASENDIFGGGTSDGKKQVSSEDSTDSPKTEAPEPASKSASAQSEETLQIGGTLSSQADLYVLDGVPLSQDPASNPNILFLYLDSKLESDSRVFARLRLFYDPTGLSGGTPGFSSLTNPYGFGSGSSENLNWSLQELRISANLDRKIFFTIGRQKVKYGAAKFFNPTDFLNSQAFNFFLPSDERTGVDMIKAHIPAGIANFYAAGLVGNPTAGNPSGGYFRGEVAYDGGGDFLGSGEISLSGYLPKDKAGRAGFDISQALGDFDVYIEGALGQDKIGDWKDAVSAGASWSLRYGDRASNTISFQGEYFQAGNLVENGAFSLYLPEPGNLTHITFVETNLFNFMDESGLSRLDTSYQFTQQITGRVYVSGHWGRLGGLFHMPGQVAEMGTRLDVAF